MPYFWHMAKQDPENYRKHSDLNKELIKKSLSKLGAGRSVLVDSEDYLIAGNSVMEQAQALGIPTCVIETDGSELVVVKRTDLKLDDPKRKELALADNATSDTSEWDVDALVNEWGEDELNDWGVNIEWPEGIAPAEDTGVPEIKPDPETVLGDLYELNGHRVLCDSCISDSALDVLHNGTSADMSFTDPPFDLEDISYSDQLISRTDGHIFICNSEQRNVDISSRHRDKLTRWYAVDFRQAHLIANNRPMNRVDFVAEFRTSEKVKFNNLNKGFTTLIECCKIHSTKGETEHTQEKKVELPTLFIEHHTQKKDVVSDYFLGSGSTLISCEDLSRICYGTEISPNYCDVIVRRWVQYMIANEKPFTVKRNGEDITDAQWLKQ